ncbi:MAG: helix-turn-helix domain-containing protein [Ruminococcaceae bacterium]|nr:helix-turn-helix domain-containing protein [Oscillospiraceae bacterium]
MSKNIDNIVKQIKSHCEISIHKNSVRSFIPTHWHDYFEFELVLEGSYDHVCNGKKYVAHRGDAWIMSYFDHHSLEPHDDGKILNIGFSPDYVSGELSDYIARFSNILCRFDENETQYLCARCQKLKEEFENHAPFYRQNSEALLSEIIIITLRKSDRNAGDISHLPGILQSVTSYLHKNFNSDVALSSVAEKFYVSPGHLGFLFKKTFGTSYNNYVNRIRMKHACNMLSSSELPIREIALRSGYNSQEHFFYTFKKHFGCTPLTYRTNNPQK